MPVKKSPVKTTSKKAKGAAYVSAYDLAKKAKTASSDLLSTVSGVAEQVLGKVESLLGMTPTKKASAKKSPATKSKRTAKAATAKAMNTAKGIAMKVTPAKAKAAPGKSSSKKATSAKSSTIKKPAAKMKPAAKKLKAR